MNQTRATLLLAAVALMSLVTTGCHRHRVARGVYPTAAYQPVMYQQMGAPQPIVIVVETRGQAASEVAVVEDNSAQEAAAAQQEAAREQASRRALLERERAMMEREQARMARAQAERARREQERAERERARQEQAQRDAQARAAAQGGTTIIVISPGQKPVQVDGSWFQGQ